MTSFPGSRELDWCRNYLSPFSQHSSSQSRAARSWKSQRSQCLCHSQVFARPKGKLLWEEQRGCTPFGLPHARCLISSL